MTGLQPTALLASGLLTRALKLLDSSPGPADNRETLRRVVLLARQTGALDRAEQAARRLTALEPQDQEAAYLAAMLAGRTADRTQSDWPANFIRISNYLPPAAYQRLIAQLAPACAAMTDSVVYRDGAHLVAPERRRSTSTTAVDPASEELRRSVLDRLPEWCERLGIPYFEAEAGLLKLTRYRGNDYFRRHQDDATGAARPLGFIFYLQFPAQTFSGGELLLYDGDADPWHGTTGWTAVPPEPNSLVVLPSWHWHEVAPVRGAASDDPLSGRFTLNGWLFRAGHGD